MSKLITLVHEAKFSLAELHDTEKTYILPNRNR